MYRYNDFTTEIEDEFYDYLKKIHSERPLILIKIEKDIITLDAEFVDSGYRMWIKNEPNINLLKLIMEFEIKWCESNWWYNKYVTDENKEWLRNYKLEMAKL